jgi:hypothetical protein
MRTKNFGQKLRNRVNEVGILEETVIIGLRDVRFSDLAPYWCAVGYKVKV